MAPPDKDAARLALDFLAVRRAVGTIALILPLVLLVGGSLLFAVAQQPTISHYHGTAMRDVFVGLLFANGVFLIAYRGYGIQDLYAGRVAGILLLTVALFPTTGPTARIHFVAAALFFLTIALTSLLLFTRSRHAKGMRPAGKRRRNAVHRICGSGILVCMALIAVYKVALEGRFPGLDGAGPVFWLEAVAVWLFGASWLVKGEALRSALAPRRVQEFFEEGEEGSAGGAGQGS